MQFEDADVTVDESATLVGLHETERPVEGVTELASAMVPVKLLRPVSVRVDDPLEPTGMF